MPDSLIYFGILITKGKSGVLQGNDAVSTAGSNN